MKVNRLTRLSTAAAILLQLGTFVHASPVFEEHNNAADLNSCQDFRVTYPTESATVFEDNTKHLIAWIPPASVQQVNITLANANQETVHWVGLFDGQKGAAGEVPVLLNGQQPGEYHFHLAGVGIPNCEVDSGVFQVTASEIKDRTTNKIQQPSPDNTDEHNNAWFTNDDQRTHADKAMNEELDALADKHNNAGEWFTNDDQRTHADKAMNEELDALADKHDNAGEWFTNDDQRTHLDKATMEELDMLQNGEASHEDGMEAWVAEEIDVPSGKQWRDESPEAYVADHSDVGEWVAEELDQQHMDAMGFYVEEHVDDNQVPDIVDYSSESSFAAEEISEHEDVYVPTHEDGWVSDDDKPFDHTNVGSFIAEEIDTETSTPNDHDDATEWIAEEIDATEHINADWTDESELMTEESAPMTEEWVDESDLVDQASTDESAHIDEMAWVAEEVDENGSSNHENSAEDEWHVDDESLDEPNWHVDEVPSSSWTDESSSATDIPDHTDESPITWEEIPADHEETNQEQHVDAVENWIEETVHSDTVHFSKPSTGYMAQENTHSDSVDAPGRPQNLVANW